MTALKDYSERMMRAAIRAPAAGEYRFEDYLDNDGITDQPGEDRRHGHHSRRSRDRRFHRAPIRKWKAR